ncbi:MAG TPA: ubiquinone/menaquinone biosynthesis methyltransferase [Myxococcota bacterium]|nr:ubiquinone/menaquinone biosynthesis methyltransferase [Myxococcota bacterium]
MNDAPRSPSKPLLRMFDKVPRRYDMINRLFTLGLDQRWRRLAAWACLEGKPSRVLDLGCGTGDLAIQLARRAPAGTEIIGADFSKPMLEVARAKAVRADLADRLGFVWADAGRLPWPDGHFDAIGISFAFRNLTFRNSGRDAYLAEMRRVLASGGRLVIVESSQPRAPVMRALVHWYQRAIVERLGGSLSGEKAAYRYLAESATRFYTDQEVGELLESAGFARVAHTPLLAGAAALHLAHRD